MHCTTLLSLFSLATLVLVPSLARADESSTPAPATVLDAPAAARLPERWYGWQPLMVDTSTIASLVGGGFAKGTGGETAIILGSAGYLFASPLIHLAHDHAGKAGASLVLRVLLPVGATFTGMLVGAATAPKDGSGWGTGWYEGLGGIFGAMWGAALAAGIDDIVLSREAVRPAPADARPTIEPRVTSVRGGATFGFGGTF